MNDDLTGETAIVTAYAEVCGKLDTAIADFYGRLAGGMSSDEPITEAWTDEQATDILRGSVCDVFPAIAAAGNEEVINVLVNFAMERMRIAPERVATE